MVYVVHVEAVEYARKDYDKTPLNEAISLFVRDMTDKYGYPEADVLVEIDTDGDTWEDEDGDSSVEGKITLTASISVSTNSWGDAEWCALEEAENRFPLFDRENMTVSAYC
jgi:hypothetical protein